ncbi:GcrA family cell cycle regulator [Sinorhizobium fredii]|uniref:GcrA family cell cycle regulator n=1 Tax=Rhizobium fredii TaxID=380 RepID=UPI0009B6056B|nr:GcrA family cell cycle regulator [Sinorhizobium fredii]
MKHEEDIAAPAPAIKPRLVPLIEISESQCRYPVLPASSAPGKFLFCGLPVARGHTFCPYHHALCWHAKHVAHPGGPVPIHRRMGR